MRATHGAGWRVVYCLPMAHRGGGRARAHHTRGGGSDGGHVATVSPVFLGAQLERVCEQKLGVLYPLTVGTCVPTLDT